MRHLISLAAALLLVVVACDGADQPSPGAAEPSPAEPANGASVSIFDLGFDPATLNASVGQVVRWTNDGELPHTVTFEEGPDSGSLSSGQNFEHAFEATGIYSYVCTIHPSMQGVVNVGP